MKLLVQGIPQKTLMPFVRVWRLKSSARQKHHSYRVFQDAFGQQFQLHCIKSLRIRSYSGLYFPAFRLNTERHGVSLRIQSEYAKNRIRIISNTDTFHEVLDLHGFRDLRAIAIKPSISFYNPWKHFISPNLFRIWENTIQ